MLTDVLPHLAQTLEAAVRGALRSFFVRHLRERVAWMVMREPHVFGDPARVTIAPTAVVLNAVLNVSSGTISVQAAFGVRSPATRQASIEAAGG